MKPLIGVWIFFAESRKLSVRRIFSSTTRSLRFSAETSDPSPRKPASRQLLLVLDLDERTRREVMALLAYAEDDAGGLMNPRYARLRPEMKVDEAISYLRMQARERLAAIYYVYVLDAEQHLLGVVPFRELFAAASDRTVRDIMRHVKVVAREDMDQEDVGRLFSNTASWRSRWSTPRIA